MSACTIVWLSEYLVTKKTYLTVRPYIGLHDNGSAPTHRAFGPNYSYQLWTYPIISGASEGGVGELESQPFRPKIKKEDI